MIEIPSGWGLAPAYDLLNIAIILPEDKEELALTLSGKKKKLRQSHFQQLGEGLGLTSTQIKRSFHRMIKNKSKAFDWVDRSFLSKERKSAYKEVVEKRYGQLGLND